MQTILLYVLFTMPGYVPTYQTTEPNRCEAVAAQLGAPYQCQTVLVLK